MDPQLQSEAPKASLCSILGRQRAAYQKAPYASAEHRIAKLRKLKKALLEHQHVFIDALKEDFGTRAKEETLMLEVLPCINQINYTVKRLKKWMKPERRHAGLMLTPASVEVMFQPLGIIGIMVPWNGPVNLSLVPLITAIAAGNRAMIKLSEFTPATNKAIRLLLGQVFTEDEVAVVEGEADVAAQFSALPFDHLLFTGATEIGRHVMRAASVNLTPVTLELGGKSPVIIADDIDISVAVERMAFAKCVNSGQVCISPDYVLCPEGKEKDFVEAYKARFQAMYREASTSEDHTSIISDRQYQRLTSWLEDARAKGAIIVSADGKGADEASRKMATQLITNVSEDMTILQQEIFGPLLPIITYKSLDEAIAYVNGRPRPLALYVMSFDKTVQKQVLTRTHSGGVCVNDTLFHFVADDAPFGGIGPSGMGHYHGKEGFLNFSKAKTVLTRSKFYPGKLIQPPYSKSMVKLVLKIFMR